MVNAAVYLAERMSPSSIRRMISLVARARIFGKYGVRSLRYLRNKLTILWLRAKGCEIDWAVSIHPDAVFDLSGGGIKIGAHPQIMGFLTPLSRCIGKE